MALYFIDYLEKDRFRGEDTYRKKERENSMGIMPLLLQKNKDKDI